MKILVKKIAELILNTIPPEGKTIEISMSFFYELQNGLIKYERLSNLIEEITIRNLPNIFTKCNVGMSEAGYSSFDYKLILDIIKKKEKN